MSENYFKAVRPDLCSFYDPWFQWPDVGGTATHPYPEIVDKENPHGYLSASVAPTDCTGFKWLTGGRRAVLLAVQTYHEIWTPRPAAYPNARASKRWRVVSRLPSWMLWGHDGREVAALIDYDLDEVEAQRLRDAASNRDSSEITAARSWWASWASANHQACRDAWTARDDRADTWKALIMRHSIIDSESRDVYEILSRAWRESVGEIHEGDAAVRRAS